MSSFEVGEPILNSPYAEPGAYWYIREGQSPEKRSGRRPSIVFPPQDQRQPWEEQPGVIRRCTDYPAGFELELVNDLRDRVRQWREQGWPGTTRTTLELLEYWRREGRDPRKRLFFAQLEAAETIIFLKEARADFRQGLAIPRDDPGEEQRREGFTGFERLAAKMATGSGKTTVMAMITAWSILNKAAARGDGRFSETVLIVCPNVTIRNRLTELDPHLDEASLYRVRDLVPPHLMPRLRQHGRVLVTNWHVLQAQSAQTGGIGAKVIRTGRCITTTETITIGHKTDTVRGTRYMTLADLQRQAAAGLLHVEKEERGRDGALKKVRVRTERHVESDTALVDRVLGREGSGKGNILVMNDEAHHAYRIIRESEAGQDEDFFGEDEEAEGFYREATVWVDGLDRIHKLRGINFCLDLSATPFYLGRVGQETNKPFPWVVSDFGLIEAIESGLVKIPQLAVRDVSGSAIPGYFNIWRWILEEKLTAAERGGRRGGPRPEAILKYAHTPIAMLASLWEKACQEALAADPSSRLPVFIIVCKNTAIAKVIHEWIAEDRPPDGIPSLRIPGLRNGAGCINTIRVDSRVVQETDSSEAKSDENLWMRMVLDTVGKRDWPADRQGRPIYPEKFEALAGKLGRPLIPPGRDVRCIVSVSMLTEGWDCNTVAHIIGLRPFMSQLLCEQVVGRGLRRSSYDIDEQTGLLGEEVAKVLGVPFEVVPFKANTQAPPVDPPRRRHIHALPEKADLAIAFPRVTGYTQIIRNRIRVDWNTVAPLLLEPGTIPPEVEVRGLSVNNQGRMSLSGPGRLDALTLADFRQSRRTQELAFELARNLTRTFTTQADNAVPAQVLFPQFLAVVRRYLAEKVQVTLPADPKDLFLAPYYGWLMERLLAAVQPDQSAGESPEVPVYEAHRGQGGTADVDFWTTRDVREVVKSHVNYVVADTARWEQSAACLIDRHPRVFSFVKNAGLGFAVPYLHDGRQHEYYPDFIVRLEGEPPRTLILETKGHDPLAEIKQQAAQRWVDAVNADGAHGQWRYAMVRKPEETTRAIDAAAG